MRTTKGFTPFPQGDRSRDQALQVVIGSSFLFLLLFGGEGVVLVSSFLFLGGGKARLFGVAFSRAADESEAIREVWGPAHLRHLASRPEAVRAPAAASPLFPAGICSEFWWRGWTIPQSVAPSWLHLVLLYPPTPILIFQEPLASQGNLPAKLICSSLGPNVPFFRAPPTDSLPLFMEGHPCCH